MAVDGLEISLESLPPGFGKLGVVGGGLEVSFRWGGDRWGGPRLGGECGVEGEEVGEALGDGEGAEGEAEGDDVRGVRFWIWGELGGRYGDLHSCVGEWRILFEVL